MICDVCRKPMPNHQTVHVVGRGVLCFSCYNDEAARRMGVEFDNVQLAPVSLIDSEGSSHTFDIRSHLVATGHAMEAIETREGEARGYSFAVIGDFEADAMTLFGQLYQRMREGLSTRYVRPGRYGWELTEGETLVGRIEADPRTDPSQPTVVVDGNELAWEDLGHMLMTFEGFVVEMRIRDRFDIVGGPLLQEEDDSVR